MSQAVAGSTWQAGYAQLHRLRERKKLTVVDFVLASVIGWESDEQGVLVTQYEALKMKLASLGQSVGITTVRRSVAKLAKEGVLFFERAYRGIKILSFTKNPDRAKDRKALVATKNFKRMEKSLQRKALEEEEARSLKAEVVEPLHAEPKATEAETLACPKSSPVVLRVEVGPVVEPHVFGGFTYTRPAKKKPRRQEPSFSFNLPPLEPPPEEPKEEKSEKPSPLGSIINAIVDNSNPEELKSRYSYLEPENDPRRYFQGVDALMAEFDGSEFSMLLGRRKEQEETTRLIGLSERWMRERSPLDQDWMAFLLGQEFTGYELDAFHAIRFFNHLRVVDPLESFAQSYFRCFPESLVWKHQGWLDIVEAHQPGWWFQPHGFDNDIPESLECFEWEIDGLPLFEEAGISKATLNAYIESSDYLSSSSELNISKAAVDYFSDTFDSQEGLYLARYIKWAHSRLSYREWKSFTTDERLNIVSGLLFHNRYGYYPKVEDFLMEMESGAGENDGEYSGSWESFGNDSFYTEEGYADSHFFEGDYTHTHEDYEDDF